VVPWVRQAISSPSRGWVQDLGKGALAHGGDAGDDEPTLGDSSPVEGQQRGGAPRGHSPDKQFISTLPIEGHEERTIGHGGEARRSDLPLHLSGTPLVRQNDSGFVQRCGDSFVARFGRRFGMSELGRLVMPRTREVSSRRLAHELKKLVGWGLKEHKLRNLPLILDLPNVRRRAGEDASQEELTLAAYELIIAGVDTFSGVEHRVFHFLLALDRNAKACSTADERRRRALEILARTDDRWHMSVATWRREHEVEYLERLARRMYLLPGATVVDLTPESQAEQEAKVRGFVAPNENSNTVSLEYGPDPRSAYKTLSIRMLYKFHSGRVPEYQETEKVVQALIDNVDRWREGVSYTVSNDEIELEVLSGAQIVRALRGNFYGHRYWDLQFPQPLRAGDPHSIRVRKVVLNRLVEPLPYLIFHTLWQVDELLMRVEFALDCLPQQVARIRTATSRLREETRSSRIVPIEPDGSVETSFTDLHEGVSCGFLWTW
jgi:hypothetical protein